MTSKLNHPTHRYKGVAEGWRSGLEKDIGKQLKEKTKGKATYEPFPLHYMVPARVAKYTPDFVLPNGIVVETKGRFVTKDRQKHLLLAEQYPYLDLRFVFTNPNSKLYKGSKTTYAMWCEKHGFRYAKGMVPLDWIKEAKCETRLAAIEQAKTKPTVDPS